MNITEYQSQSSFYPGVLSDVFVSVFVGLLLLRLNPVSILGFFLTVETPLLRHFGSHVSQSSFYPGVLSDPPTERRRNEKCLNPVSILGFFLTWVRLPPSAQIKTKSQSSFYPGVLSDDFVRFTNIDFAALSQSSFYPGVLSDPKQKFITLNLGGNVSIQFLSWGSF